MPSMDSLTQPLTSDAVKKRSSAKQTKKKTAKLEKNKVSDLIVSPPQVDALPSMVDLLRELVLLKKNDPTFFEARGKDSDEVMVNFELDNAKIMETYTSLILGKTWKERRNIFFYMFKNKTKLIATIHTLEFAVQKSAASNGNIAQLMWQQRWCYPRQHSETTSEPVVIDTVMLKLVQLMFLLTFITGQESPFKCLLLPPPDWILGLKAVSRDMPQRDGLKEKVIDVKLLPEATLPFHPDWFKNDVPLLASPMFSHHIVHLEDIFKRQPGCFAAKLNFLELFLVHVTGVLQGQLDLVSMFQTKLMGGMGAVALACYTLLLPHMTVVAHEWFSNSTNSSA